MPKDIILQPRDIASLSLMGDLGLIDTDTLHARIFSEVTRRRCQQRLGLYQEHSLTRVIRLSVWNAGTTGNRVPTIHCLTDRGADALEAATGLRPLRIARSDPKPETIFHRLMIVKSRLAIDDAFTAASLAKPIWIMEQDFDPSASAALPPSHRRLLHHTFQASPRPIICQPDAACWMRVPREPPNSAAGLIDLLGFWEIDCSTEGREQVRQKLPGYAMLIERQAYRRYWPQIAKPAIRIFCVCRSLQRISALSEKLRDIPIARLIRFASNDELKATTALAAPIWQDLDGSRREILRVCPQVGGTR